jgi:putative IMPACT (imprinted ancient) family translation regulator
MRTVEQYRAHAHDCLRRAHADSNENDKPLWLTLAQSWLQLAEHADRFSGEVHSVEQDEVHLAETETEGIAVD